jgi:hypothetical protein
VAVGAISSEAYKALYPAQRIQLLAAASRRLTEFARKPSIAGELIEQFVLAAVRVHNARVSDTCPHCGTHALDIIANRAVSLSYHRDGMYSIREPRVR